MRVKTTCSWTRIHTFRVHAGLVIVTVRINDTFRMTSFLCLRLTNKSILASANRNITVAGNAVGVVSARVGITWTVGFWFTVGVRIAIKTSQTSASQLIVVLVTLCIVATCTGVAFRISFCRNENINKLIGTISWKLQNNFS